MVIHGAEVMLTNRRPYGALVIGSTKITQNEAAKRLAASFCIVPDDIQDMSCSYTGDNPRNVQDKRKVSASLCHASKGSIIGLAKMLRV